jgi:outer membrane autotransporter protein
MKKVLIIAALLASFNASAVEVGVNGGVITGDSGGLATVTIGEKFGKFGVEAGYGQAWLDSSTQNRWTLVGSYDVYTADKFVVAGKVGYVYLNNQSVVSGSAATVGVGVTVPLNKNWAATVDYAYQMAESGVTQFNGNIVTAGVKYKF